MTADQQAIRAEPRSTWPIVFLVYDARSGSTLLSEMLTRRLNQIYVTPEIAFIRLLKLAGQHSQHVRRQDLFGKLSSDNLVRNLGIGADDLRGIVAEFPDSVRTAVVIRRILEGHLDSATVNLPRCVVIKHGIHVRVWREIVSAFGAAARFIHIYRDPRAVVNSKLRTIRPYNQHEAQAWYGPLLAAWRWRAYSIAMRAARASGVPVLDVAYEELLDDSEAQIRRVANFLGVSVGIQSGARDPDYRIPDAERLIHPLVHSGHVHHERAGAWVSELSARDLRTIEAVALGEMQARGYQLSQRLSGPERIIMILAELPRVAQALTAHGWRCLSQRRSAPTRPVGARSEPRD